MFLIMPMNLSDIAILNINGVDYFCIITRISKGEAAKLLQTADLNKKKQKHIKYETFILKYKNG